MKITCFLAIFSVALSAVSSLARAAVVEVIKTPTGLPVCLKTDSKSVLLLWNEAEIYQRELTAVPLSALQPRIFGLAAKGEKTCDNWSALSNSLRYRYDRSAAVMVKTSATEILGIALTPELRQGITQIIEGAKVFHKESAQEYVVSRQKTNFSVKDDETLSQTYGIKFAQEVFQSIVESKPENQAAKEKFNAFFEQGGARLKQYADANPNLMILMSTGLGSDETADLTNHRGFFNINSLVPELHRMGIANAKSFEKNKYGTLEGNIAAIQPQLEEQLKAGRQVLLVGLSKGVPEMLAAAVRVKQANPSLPGKIIGVINLSGVLEGSIVSDYGAQSGAWGTVAGLLLGISSEKENGEHMTAIRELGHGPIGKVMANTFPLLPSDIPYLNVTGVVPGTGLARDPLVVKLQTFLYRGAMAKSGRVFGANDGYLEYPSMILDSSKSPAVVKSSTLIFGGAHMLIDGPVYGRDVDSEGSRRNVIGALLMSVLE